MGDPKKLIKSLLEAGGYEADDKTVNGIITHYGQDYKSMAKSLLDAGDFDYDDVKINSILGEYQLLNDPIKNINKPTGTLNKTQQFVGYDLFSPTAPTATPQQKAQMEDIRKKKAEAKEKEFQEADKLAQQYSSFGYTYLPPSAQPPIETASEKKNRIKSEKIAKLTEAKAEINELGSVDNIIAPYDNLKSATRTTQPVLVKKDPYEVDLFTQSLSNITPQQNSEQNLIDRENHSQFQAKYSDIFESAKEVISLDLDDPNWLDKFFDKQDKAASLTKSLNGLTEQIEKKFGNLVPPKYKASTQLISAAEDLRDEMVPLKSQIDAVDAEMERIIKQTEEQIPLLTTQEEVDTLKAEVERTLAEMNSNRQTLVGQYNSLSDQLNGLRAEEKTNIDAFKNEVSKYNKSISSDSLLTEYYKTYDDYSKAVEELDVYRNHPQFDTFVDAYEKLDKLGKVRPEIFKSDAENKKKADALRKLADQRAKDFEDKGLVQSIFEDLGFAAAWATGRLSPFKDATSFGKAGALVNKVQQFGVNVEKELLGALVGVIDFAVPGAEPMARELRYGDYYSLNKLSQKEELLQSRIPSKYIGDFVEKVYNVKEGDNITKYGIPAGSKVLLRGSGNDIVGFRDKDGYSIDILLNGDSYKGIKNEVLKNKDKIERDFSLTKGSLGTVNSALDMAALILGAPRLTTKLVSAGLSKKAAAATSTFAISTFQMYSNSYMNYLEKGLKPEEASLWALGESSAVSLVETFVSPLENKLILRGVEGQKLAQFTKLKNTVIADIASGRVGWKDGISAMYAGVKDFVENVLLENFEEFVQGDIENLFQGLATGKYEEIPVEERLNTIFATTLISALPAASSGYSAYKDAKADIVTTSLWHSSKNPEDFKKNLTELVQNGDVTRDKANEYMATVSYVSEELEAYADENLSREQEVAISGLALSRRTLEAKMTQTTNKTAVDKYKEKIKEIDANIKSVVDGTKKVEVQPGVESLINPTDDQTGLADNVGTSIEEDKPTGPVLTNDQYEEKKSRLAEIDSILSNEAQLVSAGEAPTLTEEEKSLLEEESKTLTNEINQTEDAIQKQKAGEVSVQTGAGVSEGMGGQVQPEPQVPTGEGEVQTQAEAQAKEQANKEIDAFIADQITQAEVTLALGDIDQRMTNAEYIQEAELNKRADELYKIWDSVDANENLTPEQKESIKSKLETHIQKLEQYELATANKVGETVETRTVKGPRVIGTTAKKAPSKYEVTPERIAATGTTTVTDKDGKVTQGTWQALPNGTLQVVDANGNVVPVTSGYSFMETTKDNDGNVTGAVLEDTGTGKTFTVSDPEVALDMAIKAKEMALGPIEEGIFEETVQEVVVQAQPILTREGRAAQPQAPQVQAPQVQAPTVTPVQPTVERAQPVAEKAPAEPTLPATGAAQAAPAAAPEVAAEPEAKPAPEPTTEAEMSPLERMRRAFAMEEDPGKAAERVGEFLGEAGITVEIVDQNDFEDKAQQRNFSGNADGVFLVEGDTGKILLNRNKLQDQWGKTIVFHEGIHPVMNIIKNTNPELYNNILSGIRAEAKRNTEIANAVAEVEASEEYQNRGQEVVDDEIIVEVLARIASGKVKLNEVKPSIKDRIVNFLNKIASTFGIPTISKNSTDAQFKSFAGKLSKALNTGGKIGDIVGAENVKKFKADLAQQRITSKELADNTKNKTVQGELINSMQLTSNKKGEKVVNYEGKVSLEELRKFNPQMYVNRALDLLETHLVKNKTGLDEKLKKEGKLQWADGIYKEAQDTVVSNLFFIYDNIDSSVRDISQLWYDGANIIAQEMSKKYDVTLEQASAIIASQSPQKPWFDNVHLAHFVLDFYRNNQDRVFTKEDFNYYESKSKKYPAQIAYLPKLKASIGKKFSELNSYDKSVVIRAEFDQNYERKAPIRIPTGALLDTRFKSKSSFSGYDTIAKAISVIENGTAENISNNLGAFNKVRNFYNNIAAPKTDGEVTIDTHAIAASYLLPVGSTSEEVNFDPATYAFFAEAYRKAATERGVLAREMQSIVWEGVRSIFPPTDKSAKSKAIVDNLWSNYLSDKASLQETQNKIKEYGKDLSATDWSGNVNELFESDKPSTYLGELPLASGNRPTTKRGAEVAADRGVPTMGKGVGETLAQESAGIKRGAAKIEEFTVGYAPFREGNITNLSEGEKAFENARFKSWKKMSATFAEELGLDITENNNTIGIYGATSDAAEASSVVTVRGTSDKVELFAALMGTMAPDIQHSVMAISYGKKGEITDNRFTFKNKKGALKFIEERGNFGANDLSFIPETNTVIILDFGDFNYNKFLKVYGKAIKQTKQVWGTARFIEEGEYSGIIQKVRSSVGGLDGPNGRTNYDSILELAQKRADRRSGNLLAQPEQKKKFLKDSVSNYLDKFAKTFGIEPITTVSPEKVKPSKSTAMAIKQAYDNLKVDNSSDPDVKAAYEQLGKEVEEQYNYLINEVGLNVIFSENDPYDNSQHMMYDVYENNRLFVFKGGEPHSFLGDQTADENGITLNEKLRAVHDYFGHAVEGNQFGKNGEEAAWVAHSKMFSPLARRGLTTETRGQNSWVNNSPENEGALKKMRDGNKMISEGNVLEGERLVEEGKSEFQFAVQKVDILPQEFVELGEYLAAPGTAQASAGIQRGGKALSSVEETTKAIMQLSDSDLETLKKSLPTHADEPNNKITAYKLFRVNKKYPGELFPLFVDSTKSVPFDMWTEATAGELVDESAEKKMVKSKLGPLAFRPGWHSGDSPLATHIGGKANPSDTKPSLRPDNQVWAEIEVSNDFDWQPEANRRADLDKKGNIVPKTAHITDQVPLHGFYKYKTNSNMTGSWVISGEIRVKRVLTDSEVASLNKKLVNSSDLRRESPLDLQSYGFNKNGIPVNKKAIEAKQIAEAYHSSKKDGSDIEVSNLINEVENFIGTKSEEDIKKMQFASEEITKEIQDVLNTNFKETIVEKLSSFDDRISNKKFPNALEVAQKVLPRYLFNRYKSLYELAARNNITVSNEKIPRELVAAFVYGSVQLNGQKLKYNLESYDEFAETLNHEIIHGLINYGVRDQYGLYKELQAVMDNVVKNYDLASDNVKDIIDYIQDTRKEFIEKDILNATDEELDSEKFREVGSLEELITYAFTNEEFASFLDNIPASKKIPTSGASIFEQLKNIIRKIVANVSKKNTALDEINSALDNYFDTSFREEYILKNNNEYGWGLVLKEEGTLNKNESRFDVLNTNPKRIADAYYKAKKDSFMVSTSENLLGTAQASAGIQRTPLAPMINTPKKDVEKELWNNLKTAVKDYFIGDKTVGFFFDPKQQGEMKNEKFRAMVNAAVEYIKYKASQGPYTRSLFLREMYSGSLTGYPVVVDAEGAAYLFKKAGVKSYNRMVERVLATGDDRLPQVLKEAVETGALPKEPVSDEMVTNLATEILSLADEVQDEQERVLAYEDLFHEMLESFKEKIASIGGEGFKPVFIYEIRAMRMLAQRLLDLNETQKSSEVLNTLAVIAGSSGHILRQIGLNTPDAIFIEVFGKSKNKTREAILNSQAANNEEGKTNREVIDEISAGVSQTFKETSAEVDRLKTELDKALAEIQRLKKKPKEVKEETVGTVAYYKQKANSYLESYKKTMKSLGLSSGINPQFLRAGMDYTMYLYYTFRGNMAKVKSEFFKSEELKPLRPEWDNIVGSLADEMKAADSEIVRNLILEELTKQDSDKQTRDSAKMSPAQLVARSIRTKIANLNRIASETKRPTATAQERIEKNELDIKLLNEIRQDIEAELLVVPPNRRAEVMAKVDDLLISLDNNTTKLRVASWVKAADIRKAFREEAKSLNMTVAEMIDDHFDVDRRTQSIAEEFLLRTGMTMEEAKPYIKEIEKQVNKYVTDVLGRKAQAKYFEALGFNVPKIDEEIRKVKEDIAELKDQPESPENKSKLRGLAAKLNKLNDRRTAAVKRLEKMAGSPQFNKMLSMIANGGLNEDTVINAFAQSLGIDTLDAKSLEHFNTLSRKIDEAKFAVDKLEAEKELKKFIYRVQNKSIYEMTLQMLEAWAYGNMLSGPPTANTALMTGLAQIAQDLTVTFGQAMLKDFRGLFATGEFTNLKLYFDSVKSVFFDLKVFDTSTAVGVLMGEEGISLQDLDMGTGKLTANLAMIDKLKSMISEIKASDKNAVAKKMGILAAGLFIQQQRLARMLVVSDYITRSVTFPFSAHRILIDQAIDQLNLEYVTENPGGPPRKPAYVEIHKRVTEMLRKEELDAAVEAKRAEVGEGFDAERYRRSIKLDMLPQNVRELAKIYADNAAAAGDPSGYSSIAYKMLNSVLNGSPLDADSREISPYDSEVSKIWNFGKRLTRMMFKFLVASPFPRILVLGAKGVKNTLPIASFQFSLDKNNKIKGVQFFKENRYYDSISGGPEKIIEADPVTRASRHAMAWATSITLATLFTQLFEIVPDEEEQEGFKIVEDKDPPIFITTDYDPTVEGWFKSQGIPYYVHSVYRKNDEGRLEKSFTYKDNYWGWVFRSLGTVQERLKYRVKKKGDEGAKYDNVSETDAYLMMLYGLTAFVGEYGLNDMTEKLSALMDVISTESKSTIGNAVSSGQRFLDRLPGQAAALMYPVKGFATWAQTIKGMALEENKKRGYNAFTEGTANTLGMSSLVDSEDFDDLGRPIPYTGTTYGGIRGIEEGIAAIWNERYRTMDQTNFVDRITNADKILGKYPDLRGSVYKGSPKDASKNNFTVIEAPTDKLIIKDLKKKAADKKNELLLNYYDYMDGLTKKELETTLKAVQRRANDYVFIDYMITILSNSPNIYNTNIDVDQLRSDVTSVAKDGIGVLPEDPTAYYSRKKFMDILYANGIKIKSDGRVITDKNYSEVYNSTGLVVPVETQYDDSEETSDSWW